ncbi:uncharacterized protein LOC131650888 [Vicia villosa]|uniref:uncharacterized protein LOC131650888 n=1 Tax=Vicia villosa TaxID=3911 RepID=UPI00273CD745|nr:uncharacterized protein LOC131650888 [Vicia villosa]
MDAALLFPETNLSSLPPSEPNPTNKHSAPPKSFANVVADNVCDIPLSQFPPACVKGDRLAITIPEEEYALGVEACKHHLHGRIVWSKGSAPLTVASLKAKLLQLWPSIGKWGITSLGKGFFEFAFSTLEDVQRVRSVSAWNLSHGVLKLFPWTKDFTPATLKQTSAQVWIRIHGLSQEYWRPRIIFAIASSIGTPICIDSASNKSAFDRPFGHFVRVLVDLDMLKEQTFKVLVERIGFAFFVDIEYEKLPEFCNHCSCIGHSIENCKRKEMSKEQDKNTNSKKIVGKQIYIPKKTPIVDKPVGSPEVNEDSITPTIQVEHAAETSNPINVRHIEPTIEGDNRDEPIHLSSQEEEGKSDNEYVDATQLVEFVPETQIDPAIKEQVTNFLHEAWANMAEHDQNDDNGVDIFPDKDFQLVLNKKKRNKKALTLSQTRPRSSLNKLSL